MADEKCVCRNEAGANIFDEDSFATVCKRLHLSHDSAAQERQVLTMFLEVCHNDRQNHQFLVQLKGGPQHKSISRFESEWYQRKQVNITSLAKSFLLHQKCWVRRHCILNDQASVSSKPTHTPVL